MTEIPAEPISEVRFPGENVELRGHFAPASATPAPAVVLLPDVFGISPLYRELAERLAATGLHVLILDIYVRQGLPELGDFKTIMDLIATLDDRQVLSDIAAAARWLSGHPAVAGESVGVLGFCLGGQYALMAGCRLPHLQAAVSFYGMLRQSSAGPHKEADPLEMAPQLRCPWLGHFGAEDALIPLADVEILRSTLLATDRSAQIEIYPDAGHAFMNATRPEAFRAHSAELAWSRTVEFFAVSLRRET